MIAPRNAPAQVSDQFAAHILWMGTEPLLAGRSYLMRAGDKWTTVSVTAIKHKIDVHTLDRLAARELMLNEIAVCNIATSASIPFDTYEENRAPARSFWSIASPMTPSPRA
jgi:bifunctional enzyme CysN/CysC